MRLLLDLQCVQSTSSTRGIGRYALSLARGLAQTAGPHQVEALLSSGGDTRRLLRARSALETFLPPRAVHVFDADWPWWHPTSPERRQAAEQARQAALASLAPDVVLLGSVFEGDGENVISIDGSIRTAAVMYDVIPARDPGTYLLGPGADDYWRRFEELRRCDLLLAISRYSADQAKLFVPDCPPTIPIGGAPFPSDAFPGFGPEGGERPVPTERRFVLTVGGDHPRKNLDRLVTAWGALHPEVRRGTRLVVACRLNSGTARRLRRLARRAGLREDEVVLTGEVAEKTLDALYAAAFGFVFPSLEEGLGLPPLEAMARGCPTVMAHGSSLSELSENPRSFFDGTDVKDMTRALRELIQDADLRDELHVEATQATARFTWHRTAERAWSALEQLTPHKPATNPGWPSPVGLRAEAVTDLPRSPAAVVADAESLSGLGDDPTEAALELASPLPRGVRSALAPALAVVTEQAHDLIAAGVVDLPLIGAAGLDRASAHDVHAHYAPRLHQIDLLPGQGSDIAAAMTQSARWTLQRPRMVWLLLTTSWKTEADSIRALAEAHDADLVVGGPTAVILASGADEVLVSDDLVSALLPTLLQARCRGAGIVVLGEDHPDWARSAAAPRHKGDWPAVLAEVAAGAKRRTGWPWTASGETAPHGPVGNA